MTRSALALALLLVVSAGQAYADDACPKMSASDMDEQWQRSASRSSAKHFTQGNQLECVSLEAGTTPLVCHTKAGAPAHPSLIVWRMLMRGGAAEMRLDGYTAGDCAEFGALMFQFKYAMSVQERRNNSPADR
jgi:hypothetical protein